MSRNVQSALTEEQKKALQDFLAQAKDTPEDAAIRNLRSCSFDVAQSVAKYNAMLTWRAENKIDQLHAGVDQELMNNYRKVLPNAHIGFDKEGRPVYYQKTGMVQAELLRFFDENVGVTICHVWDMENKRLRSLEQTKKLGKLIDTHTNVLDMEGVSLAVKDLLPILQRVTDQDLRYYPETLGQCIVLNAPSWAPTIWAVIKAFLDPVVASRVVILSYDYKDSLLNLIDKSQVPVCFGGEFPFSFPKFDYQTTLQDFENDEKKRGFVTHNVAAGSTLEVSEAVNEGAVLTISYSFRTVGYDIYFSVSFTSEDGKTNTPIFLSTRVDSHRFKITKKLNFTAPSKGTVTVCWDNTPSYWNAKDVVHLVSFNVVK